MAENEKFWIVLDREIGLDREEFNWPALTNREPPLFPALNRFAAIVNEEAGQQTLDFPGAIGLNVTVAGNG